MNDSVIQYGPKGNTKEIEDILPVGWCHGDRYSIAQWEGPEKFC